MAETTWLTRAQYDSLVEEMRERTEVRRPAIASLIDAARQEGDLKENGGYHAAREEQSMNETRVLQLEGLLKDAHVGETPADDGVVEPGMVVTAEIFGREEKFLVGSRDAGADLGIAVYSPSAPLGKAIVGAARGSTVSYEAPNGMAVEVKIIDCTPYVS